MEINTTQWLQQPGGTITPQAHEAVLKACTLYSLNDMLYQDGMITLEKKQQVAQEIWKKYHV